MRNPHFEHFANESRARVHNASLRSRSAMLHTVEFDGNGEFLWADYTYRYGSRVYAVLLRSPRYVQLQRQWLEDPNPDRPVDTEVRCYFDTIEINAPIDYSADSVACFLNKYFESLRS